MAETTDILWGMYLEHTTQGRHHESQRTSMTNLILAICAGVLGLFALDKDPSYIHVVLSVFVMALGFFGAIFSAKHYERFSMHMERARNYRDELESLLPETKIKTLKKEADSRAKAKYPRLFNLRLFWFWIAIQLLVSVVGLVLLSWSLVTLCA